MSATRKTKGKGKRIAATVKRQVPVVRQVVDPVVAIGTSDWHLCHQRPIARADPNWYAVMERYLDQLRVVQEEHKRPVLVAGDIFDKWNSCPELINFALNRIPTDTYVVAGQHDLPFHNYQDWKKSALGTLVLSDAVHLLDYDDCGDGVYLSGNNLVRGFSWGCPIQPPDNSDGGINIAVVHAYVWASKDTAHPGATESQRVPAFRKQLVGYDVAIFGDNHSGFINAQDGYTTIVNCGTFIRRHANEIKNKPALALIRRSGKVDLHYLDTSEDKFASRIELEQQLDEAFDASVFVKLLKSVGSTGTFNFEQIVRQASVQMDLNEEVKQELLLALEKQSC